MAGAVFRELGPVRTIMTVVTPGIVNNVSCVNRINDECYFAWQAEYLVSLGHDTCCSAQCK